MGAPDCFHTFSFLFCFCPFSRERKIDSSQQSNLCCLSTASPSWCLCVRVCLSERQRKEMCWVWCMVFHSTLFHSWIYSWCCKVLAWSVGGRCVFVHLCYWEKGVWKGWEASRLHSTKTNKPFVHEMIPCVPPFLKIIFRMHVSFGNQIFWFFNLTRIYFYI